jgi:hypothetical protein
MKTAVFWNVTPCIPVNSYQCFIVTCRLNVQGSIPSLLYTEYGGRGFLPNVNNNFPEYRESHPED